MKRITNHKANNYVHLNELLILGFKLFYHRTPAELETENLTTKSCLQHFKL